MLQSSKLICFLVLLYLEKRLFTEEKLGEVKEEFERTDSIDTEKKSCEDTMRK